MRNEIDAFDVRQHPIHDQDVEILALRAAQALAACLLGQDDMAVRRKSFGDEAATSASSSISNIRIGRSLARSSPDPTHLTSLRRLDKRREETLGKINVGNTALRIPPHLDSRQH
ncbi:hypothetical protein ACFSLT_23775 [Novosphingobium resinovorum]